MPSTLASSEAADSKYVQTVNKQDDFARSLFAEIDAGGNPDLDQLRGTSGVRFEPTTWSELLALIEDGSAPALGQLGRSPLGLKHYWDRCREIKTKEFVSMLDYLYVHVFGVPSIKTGDGRLQAQLPSGFLETEKISWMENDFPYWYEPGIEHHCLWSTTPLSEDRIKQEIVWHRGAGYETAWFQNPVVLMSCPQIWHVHILSRPVQG
ncbi:hypothetical protein ACKKBF_B39365 [Auxenochlorella protothecoides x Auxenochlorella symbiontica]